ncbi:hypothetical protein EV2_037173 [Malus domestica]
MVRDLIDPGSYEWKTDIVKGGFLKEDVSSILNIPLSRCGMSDRLVWHHSKNGEYTVKTGYGVALGLMENGDLGKKGRGMPSLVSSLTQVWNKIWKLELNSFDLEGNDFLASWGSFCSRVKGKDNEMELLQEFVWALASLEKQERLSLQRRDPSTP